MQITASPAYWHFYCMINAFSQENKMSISNHSDFIEWVLSLLINLLIAHLTGHWQWLGISGFLFIGARSLGCWWRSTVLGLYYCLGSCSYCICLLFILVLLNWIQITLLQTSKGLFGSSWKLFSNLENSFDKVYWTGFFLFHNFFFPENRLVCLESILGVFSCSRKCFKQPLKWWRILSKLKNLYLNIHHHRRW